MLPVSLHSNQEDLYKLILLTAPSIPIHHIIVLPSSAGLNKKLVEALKQKYLAYLHAVI
jgi:hypothetical protein